MGLLDVLLDQAPRGTVEELGGRFSLDSDATRAVLGQLVPALSGGLRRNTAETNGLEALTRTLEGGRHQQYLDDARRLAEPETVDDGNAILGHIFGSKDVSRAVASRAAEQTGIDSGTIKQMLPVVATMVMGSLSKQAAPNRAMASSQGGGGDLLTSLLDQDGDGSIADDLLGLAKRFL